MKKVWKWKVECQHNSVNVKVLEKKVDGGVRTGVKMVPRDYRGTQWKEKWKGKLGVSLGIKLLVTGKYSEEKWENGVEGASLNGMMPMGSYLENTVNTVIKIRIQWLGIQKIQWLRNKKQEWKLECQQNAVNEKLSGDYSEWEMRKGSGRG